MQIADGTGPPVAENGGNKLSGRAAPGAKKTSRSEKKPRGPRSAIGEKRERRKENENRRGVYWAAGIVDQDIRRGRPESRSWRDSRAAQAHRSQRRIRGAWIRPRRPNEQNGIGGFASERSRDFVRRGLRRKIDRKRRPQSSRPTMPMPIARGARPGHQREFVLKISTVIPID